MGLFFSALTRNQIVAAVLTFAGMMFLLLTVMAQDFAVLSPGLDSASASSISSTCGNSLCRGSSRCRRC